MNARKVTTSTGAVVELTLERCQAVRLDHRRCTSKDFRGEHGDVLCWVHRQALKVRPLLLMPRDR